MRRGMLAALIALGIVVAGGLAAAAALGLLTVERHTGFYAPVWDAEADGIYYVERDSFGIAWGFGWEHFSPPAYSYVMRDRFRLRHLEIDAQPVTLGEWSSSPVEGRVTRNYRGRIFNAVSARLGATADGAAFLVAMSIPRVPSSEQWSLQGTWSAATGVTGEWRQAWAGYTAGSDEVLMRGVEIMTVPGRESYPAAILAVNAEGSVDVLVHNRHFAGIYPESVPAEMIAARARREDIERNRDFRRVEDKLVARFKAEGLNEGAAKLRTIEEMEELGYLPKRPRLVAASVDDVPPGTRVFDIPPDYFKVGLFQDIAAAIAAPGTEVDTGTGTYLKYYDDELGPQLRDWREHGNDSFAIRTGGRAYVLTVSRPE